MRTGSKFEAQDDRCKRLRYRLSIGSGQGWLGRLALLLALAGSAGFVHTAWADNVLEADPVATMLSQPETVSDQELADIRGKSNSAVLDEERVAVILWDEKGSSGDRSALQLNKSHTDIQSVELVVTRK